MVLRERLYAFVLRRVLGPVLAEESRARLSRLLELSLPEGRFVLRDVALCPAYLTASARGRLTVERAFVRRLEIRLSLRSSSADEDSGDSTTTSTGSTVRRVLSLGRGASSSVALVASVELVGPEIRLSPGSGTGSTEEEEEKEKEKTRDETEKSAGGGYLSSLVDAALSSLRLDVRVSNLKLDFAERAGVVGASVALRSLGYRDSPTTNGNDGNNDDGGGRRKELLRKSVEFSGLIVRTENDDDASRSSASVDGAGTIDVRARSSSDSVDLVHEVDISLPSRASVDLDAAGLRTLSELARAFGDAEERTDENVVPTRRSDVADDAFPVVAAFDRDRDEKEKEVRRSGPTDQSRIERFFASEHDDEHGDSDDLDSEDLLAASDTFFDCNETSVSQYLSVVRQHRHRPQHHDQGDDGDDGHTDVDLRLADVDVKLRFGNDDFLWTTLDDLRIATSASRRRCVATAEVRRLAMEDSVTTTTTNGGRVADVGRPLRFEEEPTTPGDLILDPAPDVSVSLEIVTAAATTTTTTTTTTRRRDVVLDVSLQPLELTYRETTVRNVQRLLAADRHDRATETSTVPHCNDTFCVTGQCPRLDLLLPLTAPSYRVSSGDLRTLFVRGRSTTTVHDDDDAHPSPSSLVLGLRIGDLVWDASDDGRAFDVACEHAALFVADGPRRATELGSASGLPGVAPDAAVRISRRSGGADDAFPTVPSLSAVKSRQRGGEDDAVSAMRAENPQNDLRAEARRCAERVEVRVPEIVVDATADELTVVRRLLREGRRRRDENDATTTKHRNRDGEKNSALAVDVACETLFVALHEGSLTSRPDNDLKSYVLVANDLRSHVTVRGSDPRSLRFLFHDATLFEANHSIDHARDDDADVLPIHNDCSSSPLRLRFGRALRSRALNGVQNAKPILHRSKLACPLSPDTPLFLLDVRWLEDEDEDEDEELTVHLSIYDATHRFDLRSAWHRRLPALLREAVTGESDTKEEITDNDDDDDNKDDGDDDDGRVIKLFVTLSDVVLDYTTLPEFRRESRSVLRASEIRGTSNLLLPARRASARSCTLSLADASLHVCDHAASYRAENAALAGGRRVLDPADLVVDDATAKSIDGSIEDALDRLRFVSVANSDAWDATVRWNRFSARTTTTTRGPPPPGILVRLTAGRTTTYCCRDSFRCLTETIDELVLALTELSEKDRAELERAAAGENTTQNAPPSITILNAIDEDPFAPAASRHDQDKDEVASNAAALSTDLRRTHRDTAAVDRRRGREPAEEQQQEQENPLLTTPDSELSATELRRKHGVVAADDVAFQTVADSLLIKQFYTLDAAARQDVPTKPSRRSPSKPPPLEEKDDDDCRLGGYEWTTVDRVWPEAADAAYRDAETGARWYDRAATDNDDAARERTNDLRVFPRHVPTPEATADPVLDGDLRAARYAGTAEDPPVALRLLVTDLHVEGRLFDGHDWTRPPPRTRRRRRRGDKREALLDELLSPENDDDRRHHPDDDDDDLFDDAPPLEPPKKGRQNGRFFVLSLQGVTSRTDVYPVSRQHSLASCARWKVTDFFLAETISGDRPKKMIGEWVNEREHPRDTHDGVIMMKMVSMRPTCKFSADRKLMSDESLVRLNLLPLRCHIDQIALRFIKNFFATSDDDDDDDGSLDVVVDRDHDDNKSSNVVRDKRDHLVGTFFRTFHVAETKLKVDYTPFGVDVAALRNGAYVELLNILPLEGMELRLSPVRIENHVGFGACLGETTSRWIEDVAASQVHKFLTGAPPFHTLTHVGEGVADLVLLPVHEMREHRRRTGGRGTGRRRVVARAVRESTSRLVDVVASETLSTTSRLARGLAVGIDRAAPRGGGDGLPASFLPARPERTPHGVGDTVEHAYESVARGLRAANHVVVSAPRREYRRTGTTGAVKSVVRGVPVAVLAPISGASEAVSYGLLGVRNRLRPDLRKEEEESQRHLR